MPFGPARELWPATSDDAGVTSRSGLGVGQMSPELAGGRLWALAGRHIKVYPAARSTRRQGLPGGKVYPAANARRSRDAT